MYRILITFNCYVCFARRVNVRWDLCRIDVFLLTFAAEQIHIKRVSSADDFSQSASDFNEASRIILLSQFTSVCEEVRRVILLILLGVSLVLVVLKVCCIL